MRSLLNLPFWLYFGSFSHHFYDAYAEKCCAGIMMKISSKPAVKSIDGSVFVSEYDSYGILVYILHGYAHISMEICNLVDPVPVRPVFGSGCKKIGSWLMKFQHCS